MSQATARLPCEGWHLSISPTRLSRQFLPVVTKRLAHLADAQSEREATAAQKGEMQGKASPQILTQGDVRWHSAWRRCVN